MISLRERKIREEMERAEELEFIASPGQVRELLEHPAWRDIVTFLEDHLEYCREGLETAEDLPKLRFIQGHIKTTKTVLGLPELLIEWAELEQERMKNEEANA